MSLALLRDELKNNFTDFTKQWTKELREVSKEHKKLSHVFGESYLRIATSLR